MVFESYIETGLVNNNNLPTEQSSQFWMITIKSVKTENSEFHSLIIGKMTIISYTEITFRKI